MGGSDYSLYDLALMLSAVKKYTSGEELRTQLTQKLVYQAYLSLSGAPPEDQNNIELNQELTEKERSALILALKGLKEECSGYGAELEQPSSLEKDGSAGRNSSAEPSAEEVVYKAGKIRRDALSVRLHAQKLRQKSTTILDKAATQRLGSQRLRWASWLMRQNMSKALSVS